jgi:hypothetical protein
MRNSRSWISVTQSVFLVLSIYLFSGCGLVTDEESDEESLVIQPKSVTLDASAVTDVVFTVSGGSGTYTWSLSDDSLGTLAAGSTTAIYTSEAVSGENTISVTDGDSTASASVIQE